MYYYRTMENYAFEKRSVESKRILYTPSSFAKEDLLHLQETGTLTALKAHESHRSHLRSYLMFIVLNGKGTLQYEGEVYHIAEGDCVFIDCSRAYVHETGADLWTLKWAHFYGHGMEGIYKKYCERGGTPVFRPVNAAIFEEELDRLYDIAISDDFLRDMKINEVLSSLLTRIMENSWLPENQKSFSLDRTDTVMREVKEYIDTHYSEKISLDELSEKFFINKFYLIRLFKVRYGDTVVNYQIGQKISAAKRMLRFSDMSIEEIGFNCGFEDANYFSRAFKKIEGSSPSVYRSIWREK